MNLASAAGRDAAASRPAAVRRGWWAPCLQAVALIAIVLVGGARIDGARADAAADTGAGPTVAVRPVVRKAAPPVTLGIPRLGLTQRLIGLRRTRTGQLQVPADPQRAGWYSEGPAPGDPGPAVIVGHVDSYRGPGVFARIKTLRKGDHIDIRRADGSLVRFQVQLVRSYSKRSFPTALVYGGGGAPTLRLVTCGGAFDPVTRHYLSNVVVFAAWQQGSVRGRP
jgi:hypothetical protein